MALRELPDTEDATASRGPSAVAGLPTFWDAAKIAPKTEWEDWWDLFMVAANAKNLISVNEIFREVTEQNPRIAGLINNLYKQAAVRKMVSVLFLSLGTAGRKSLTDKFPHIESCHNLTSRNTRKLRGSLSKVEKSHTGMMQVFLEKTYAKRVAETILAYNNGHGGRVRLWRSNGQPDFGYVYPDYE